MTREEAKKIIKEQKDNTAYFDNSIKLEDMEDMLRYRMGFGQAETFVLLAALKLVGAKFK